jgi:hypothetical protein
MQQAQTWVLWQVHGQNGSAPVPHLGHLLPLGGQQLLVGLDELQVAGGGGVVVTPQ